MNVMRSACLLFLSLLWFGNAKSQQNSEPLVRFSELTYNSYFEQLSFLGYNNGEKDYLKLFLAIDPLANTDRYNLIRREIELELQALRTKKFNKAKPEKKISLLYESVNKNILMKYQENVSFPEIFTRGIFNCLTASAYYGLLLDSLDIPYVFKETYNHVHPLAYPRAGRINIETTDPVSGIQYFDEKLKVRFVNYLLETKRISREDYEKTTVNDLFNSYYLPGKSIGLEELTGLQYMNDALHLFTQDQYVNAFEQIKKAYFIYPSSKMLAVFQFILNSTLYESDFNQLNEAGYIVFLSRLVKQDAIDAETVAKTFVFLSNEVLINRSDKALYDSIYHFLITNIKDEEVKNDIVFQYALFRGKSYLFDNKLKDALELFEKAYEINSGNLEIQTLFVSTLVNTFQNSSNGEIINRLESYMKKFPGLEKNGMFLSLEMMAYLAYVEELFDFQQPEKALGYLSKFEIIYEDNKDLDLNYKLVGDAYSAAAVYFFRKYNNAKAREYLEKGLEIAPDNFELRYRLNSL